MKPNTGAMTTAAWCGYLTNERVMSKQEFEKLCVSPRTAARMLSVSERTLWTMSQAGDLPAFRRGRLVRYLVEDLKDYIARNRMTMGGRDHE